MATITIKQIKRQHILSREEFEWVKAHLKEPLKLFSIAFSSDGSVSHVSIHRDGASVVTLFDDNYATYTIKGANAHVSSDKQI